MYKTNPTPTMTSKSRHRRTRVIQRRYRRKGRRKRFRIPPDKNSHWKTRVRIQRTYNFNTLPHHDATPLEYTTYIHEKLLHRYYKLRHLSLRNRAYLRQQRYLYYKPFGCRHIKSLHIKPPNSSPQRNPTQEALKLEAINLTTSVLLHTDSYPFVTLTKLPSDPTIQPQPCQYTPPFNNPLHTQPRFPSNPIVFILLTLWTTILKSHLSRRNYRSKKHSSPFLNILPVLLTAGFLTISISHMSTKEFNTTTTPFGDDQLLVSQSKKIPTAEFNTTLPSVLPNSNHHISHLHSQIQILPPLIQPPQLPLPTSPTMTHFSSDSSEYGNEHHKPITNINHLKEAFELYGFSFLKLPLPTSPTMTHFSSDSSESGNEPPNPITIINHLKEAFEFYSFSFLNHHIQDLDILRPSDKFTIITTK